jgi:hypothetical protein
MFTDNEGWTYNVGNLDGRQTPALYRTKTGEPLEVLGYFKDKDTMWVFVEALNATYINPVPVKGAKRKTEPPIPDVGLVE